MEIKKIIESINEVNEYFTNEIIDNNYCVMDWCEYTIVIDIPTEEKLFRFKLWIWNDPENLRIYDYWDFQLEFSKNQKIELHKRFNSKKQGWYNKIMYEKLFKKFKLSKRTDRYYPF